MREAPGKATRYKTALQVLIPVLALFFSCRTVPIGNTFDNPLVKDMYTADAAALVYRGKVYIYTGHDIAPKHHRNYIMDDWYVFSTKDFTSVKNYGPGLKYTDFKWAFGNAWAGQVIERHGKFYWYVCVNQPQTGGMAIGVAVSDKPQGPYKDAIGKPLITSDMTKFPGQKRWTWDDIDPTVFIDDDGQAYLYFGNTHLKYVKLNKDMISFDEKTGIVPVSVPEVDGLSFTEAPWLHKRGNTYYLSYAAGWEEQLAYCTSDSPEGPWKPGSRIMAHAENCNTSHHAIFKYRGDWFILYHNGTLPGGDSWHRSVCVARLYYNEDGSIQFVKP